MSLSRRARCLRLLLLLDIRKGCLRWSEDIGEDVFRSRLRGGFAECHGVAEFFLNSFFELGELIIGEHADGRHLFLEHLDRIALAPLGFFLARAVGARVGVRVPVPAVALGFDQGWSVAPGGRARQP